MVQSGLRLGLPDKWKGGRDRTHDPLTSGIGNRELTRFVNLKNTDSTRQLVPTARVFIFKVAKRAPTICASRKGGTSVGRSPLKVGSLLSLRRCALRLHIRAQAEVFP